MKQDTIKWSQVIVGSMRQFNLASKKSLVVIEPVELTESRVSAHQEYREKQPSDIIRELRMLEEEFGLRQGARRNNPQIQKARTTRHSLIKEHLIRVPLTVFVSMTRRFENWWVTMTRGVPEVYE
jgi:hypothetical protein